MKGSFFLLIIAYIYWSCYLSNDNKLSTWHFKTFFNPYQSKKVNATIMDSIVQINWGREIKKFLTELVIQWSQNLNSGLSNWKPKTFLSLWMPSLKRKSFRSSPKMSLDWHYECRFYRRGCILVCKYFGEFVKIFIWIF